MAQNAAAKAPEATKPATEPSVELDFTRTAFNRTLNIIKQEIGSLVADAGRKTPWFSKSQDEAKAKVVAIEKSFAEFVSMARRLKDEG
jgi:hypothetical protein